MTTFTVTANSDMDSLTPKTGGDVYNVNGAVLTINSDTRWAKNSTSTTGPIGNLTVVGTSANGSIVIDGTQVWWMAYDGGTGVVPASGATITGDIAGSGELIGVWSALNVAPTAAGAAMPATGFIKLKSKSSDFADNENLDGGAGTIATVNSTTGGVRGWLEIVADNNGTFTIPRLGELDANGDWFYLDDTTGSAGQILQAPNSGGTNTFYSGVQIETGVGTGVYEWYPALSTVGTSAWTTTSMTTDVRAKFVEMMDSGRFRIGSNGVNNIGYVPPAGCKVRIPNLLLLGCETATRNLNAIPAVTPGSRFDFTTTTAGVVNIDKALCNWYIFLAQAYQVNISNVATPDVIRFEEIADTLTLTDVVNGNYSNSGIDQNALIILNCYGGTTITRGKFGRAGTVAASDYSMQISDCENVNITSTIVGARSNRTAATTYSALLSTVDGGTFDDYCVAGGGVLIQSCFDLNLTNVKALDNYAGNTTTSNSMYAFYITVGSTNAVIDGYSNYLGLANVNYYAGIASLTSSIGTTLQNIGTYASPYDMGTVNAGAVVYLSNGGNTGIKVKRVYVQNTRTGFATTNNSDSGAVWQDCKSDYADTQTLAHLNMQTKNLALGWNVAAPSSVYGTHFAETFESASLGRIIIMCNEKTLVEPSASSYEIVAGTPKFTSAMNVTMNNGANEIIWTHPYYIKGHNSFQNVAPSLAGTLTGNITLEYKIDKNDGNGFSASWLALTGANLSAETFSATDGFKLKVRATVNTVASTTALSYIRLSTNVDATSQQIQYPLISQNASISFTGLAVGTEVVMFRASDNVELDREVIAGTTYTYNYEWNSDDGNINAYALIWKDDKQVIKQTGLVLNDTGTSIPISQQDDLVYSASPTLACTVDYLNELLIMDTGVVTMSVPELYSVWKDDVLLTNNAQYQFAFSIVGGDLISGSKYIPQYCFLENGWKIRPQEANHTLAVTDGIIVDAGGGDPFVNTLGAYTVRINYEQPVQAITVSTGGVTPAQVWTYSTRELTSSGVSAIQSGLATSTEISALNNISTAQVNTEVVNALTAEQVLTDSDLNKIADIVLRRATSSVEASSDGDPINLKSLYGMIAQGTHKTSITGSTLTVTKSDETTTLGTRTIGVNPNAKPIVSFDTD
jgi:hypothetical protein